MIRRGAVFLKQYLFKIWIILNVCYATVCMLHWPIGFTYFTQMSNIFAAIVCLAQLLCLLRGRKTGQPSEEKAVLHLLKYFAVLCVVITFLVFFAALGPLQPGGLLAAYLQDHGASMCMHLITPALMTIDFFANDARLPYGKKCIPLGMLPPLLYLGFILLLGGAGVRWGHGTMAAPYPFLNYDAPAGWFGYAPETIGMTTFGVGVFYVIIVFAVLTLLLSLVLQKLASVWRARML